MTRSTMVRCPVNGGPAPCMDDLCNSTSRTLCGLEEGVDFCHHLTNPDDCAECRLEDGDGGD